MNNPIRVIAMSVVLVGVLLATETYAFCYKPDPPYCIDAFGTFESDWSFNNCKSEVESYLSETDEYVSCIVRKAQRDSEEAQSEADDTIERFNCKAKGNSFCP